jgi:NAD(P)-dependent dehydrogenase (short-subunit alcohol dehydrogenase family)
MSDNWTTEKIPNLRSKVVIITGANSGIGYEATKQMARKGAQIIMACRNIEKAEAALAKINTEIPNALAEIMPLDLSRQDSVRQFAQEFKARYKSLDVLVNNAAVMAVPYRTTFDGFESHFGINHLGHFSLTGLLLELLLNTPGARVVNVSSNAHKRGNIDFDNLMYEGGVDYDRQAAYARSKLANLLFTYELQRNFQQHAVDTIAVASHPGLTNTPLADHIIVLRILRPILGFLVQQPPIGALTTLRAAVDPDVKGGEYYGPAGPTEREGFPVRVQSSAASHNLDDAHRLWQTSEQLTGVQYVWNHEERGSARKTLDH